MYPALGGLARRVGAAGVTNVLVSGAQRELVGDPGSAKDTVKDFAIGTLSGFLGEGISASLQKRTKWSGTAIESLSSFLTHTNIVSALIQGVHHLINQNPSNSPDTSQSSGASSESLWP